MKFFKQFSNFHQNKKVLGISTLLTSVTIGYTFHKYQKQENFSFSPEEIVRAEELIPTETNYQKKHEQSKLFRIVVTGGPYAGKTATISSIATRLMSLGFLVFILPESADLISQGNGSIVSGMTPEQQIVYYSAGKKKNKLKKLPAMQVQMDIEDAFHDIAVSSGKKSVILCHRGVMDLTINLKPSDFEVLMDDNGWTPVQLRDRRYDAVFHLVSTAIGNIDAFNSLNVNSNMNVEKAISLDFRYLNGWVGHSNLRIFDNSTDFETKVNRVVKTVCNLVGAPRADASLRKFLVKQQPEYLPIKFQEFDVEQTYLKNEDPEIDGFIFVRRRGQNGVNTYTHSVKRRMGNHQSAIIEKQISGKEYSTFLLKSDPSQNVVRKKIKSFIWKNQIFELIHFTDFNVITLQTQAENTDQKIELPPFIHVEKEITQTKEYHTYKMAKK